MRFLLFSLLFSVFVVFIHYCFCCCFFIYYSFLAHKYEINKQGRHCKVEKESSKVELTAAADKITTTINSYAATTTWHCCVHKLKLTSCLSLLLFRFFYFVLCAFFAAVANATVCHLVAIVVVVVACGFCKFSWLLHNMQVVTVCRMTIRCTYSFCCCCCYFNLIQLFCCFCIYLFIVIVIFCCFFFAIFWPKTLFTCAL